MGLPEGIGRGPATSPQALLGVDGFRTPLVSRQGVVALYLKRSGSGAGDSVRNLGSL